MRAEASLRLVVSRPMRPAETVAVSAAAWLSADLLRVLGAASVWGFAFSTFYLLPKFLAQELHAGPSEIGLTVGVFSIATVVATPFAGWVVDRFPRRYAMVAGSVLMAVAAAGFLGVHGLGALLDGLRVVQGLSYALVVTAVGTLVADVVPRAKLNQALGLSGSSMLVMNALAPAVAEPLAIAAGWPVVFALAAFAAAVAAVVAAGIREPSSIHAAVGKGGMRALFAQRITRHYGAVIMLTGAAFGAVFSFEPALALALGRARVGGFFVAYGIAAIVVRVGFGSVPARLGSYRVARGALALYAVVVLALAFAGPHALEPLGALFGIAHGLFYPAVNAIAVTAVRAHERGRMVAVFTGAFAAGLAAGSALLGHLAAVGGYASVFVVAAGGVAVALAVLCASPALRAAGNALEVG